VQKWGNSLALRLPKRFAEEIGINRESFVEMTIRDGAIVVTPQVEPRYTLARLLADVTPDNMHNAVETGPAVGGEEW